MALILLASKETRHQLGRPKDVYSASSINATPDANALFNRRKRKVIAVCRKYGITTLIAFGSRVREDRTPTSDLDLVAVFPEGSTLFELVNAQAELSDAFCVAVDLGTFPPADDRLQTRIDKEGVRLL